MPSSASRSASRPMRWRSPFRRQEAPRLPTFWTSCARCAFFARRRVVIVEEADPFVTKYRAEVETYVQSPASNGVLVLMVKSFASNTKLAKLVDAGGMALDCGNPGEKDLVPVAAFNWPQPSTVPELEPAAARLLVELVGAEVGILAAEIEKLSVYVASTGRIEKEHVSKMVEAGRIETVWKVLDAATVGQSRLGHSPSR